jgi:DegV family protein with EDD domain
LKALLIFEEILMANKVAIVADSTSYIPPYFLEKYPIRIAPAIVIWGEDQYRDGIDIKSDEFYQRLATAKIMPTTTQPTPLTCKEIFEELLADGYDILCIPVSSKLSGTLNSMELAKSMLPEANIEIVDSLSVSMGTGWQIKVVGDAILDGATLQEGAELALKLRDETQIFLTVDTLDFLYRGGRIGGASHFIGTALKFKPIMNFQDGKIEPLEKVRTRKKALARIVELVCEKAEGKGPVYLAVAHANTEDEANHLIDLISAELEVVDSITTGLSPGVGTHTGPGTLGVCFLPVNLG